MLPQSHVAYTWGALSLLQRRVPALRRVDYRLVAIAAMLPDIIDKPLAWAYFYRRYHAAVLFSHTLLANLTVFAVTSRRSRGVQPYALAFIGHAIIDRLWFFPDTFFWPLRGWRFHEWKKARIGADGHPARIPDHLHPASRFVGMGRVGGLLVFLWLALRHRLYRPARLWQFLSTGQMPEQ